MLNILQWYLVMLLFSIVTLPISIKLFKNFKDGAWVNATGYITKGDYHGEIPILKITDIKACDKPNNEFVYPPDENYIPTSSWL